jgi:sugar lactone lactonase YvrE
MRAEVVFEASCTLGEGPWWDADRAELVWVDIEAGRLHRGDPRTGEHRATDHGEIITAAVPRRRGGVVLPRRATIVATAVGGGDAAPDPGPDEVLELLAELPDLSTDLRFNDGACDAAGRLWIGTMSQSRRPRASLYRLEPDGELEEMLTGLTVSNGLDWSPDGATMYHIDTPAAGIDAFSYDVAEGSISERRRIVELPDHRPDGMTVDAEGGLWVAMFGSGRLHHYTPEGVLAEVVEVSTPQVTSCAFGGPELDELYITTARVDVDDPDAGAVFRCTPGVTGRPARPFAG